jgi:hypothetical protein
MPSAQNLTRTQDRSRPRAAILTRRWWTFIAVIADVGPDTHHGVCGSAVRDRFKLALDWSDASVAHIETLLAKCHEQMVNPTDEQVLQFAKLFGSYVGEVFRRTHGATWGIVTLDHQSFPGLKGSGPAGLFWPWGRARNRIRNGPEDNVWHYYQHLLSRNGVSPLSPPATTNKRTWWQRLWGE